MITVTPIWEGSGFWPEWSWPFLAAGDMNGCAIYEGATGRKTAAVEAWQAGWLGPSVLMGLNDVPGGQRRVLLSTGGESLPVTTDIPAHVIGARGSGNHNWASNVAGTVRVNGATIASDPRYLGIMASGDYFAHESIEGPESDPEWQRWVTHIYHRTAHQRVVRHSIPPRAKRLTPDGQLTYGDTSRAILNLPDGSEADITATAPPSEFCPVLRRGPYQAWWAWSVAGGNADYVIARGLPYTSGGWLLKLPWGAAYLDVACVDNAFWWLAWADANGRLGVARVLLDPEARQPLPIAWPPTEIPQPPVDPPVEPPMSAPNHLATVEAERAKYGTPLGVENAWKVTNAVAYTHRDEGFGLRRKLEGQNHNGYSIDVIIHKPSGEWIDILGSSELDGIPQWSRTIPAGDTEQFWSPPLPPEDAPEPPIEPPVDDDLEDRVRYLEEMVDHIVRTMRSV